MPSLTYSCRKLNLKITPHPKLTWEGDQQVPTEVTKGWSTWGKVCCYWWLSTRKTSKLKKTKEKLAVNGFFSYDCLLWVLSEEDSSLFAVQIAFSRRLCSFSSRWFWRPRRLSAHIFPWMASPVCKIPRWCFNSVSSCKTNLACSGLSRRYAGEKKPEYLSTPPFTALSMAPVEFRGRTCV